MDHEEIKKRIGTLEELKKALAKDLANFNLTIPRDIEETDTIIKMYEGQLNEERKSD